MEKKKSKAGRPSQYTEKVKPYLKKIIQWKGEGKTEISIAESLGVSQDTFIQYKKKYAELVEALKKGDEAVDKTVENALYKRALGYSYEEITEEQDANGTVYSRKVAKKQMPPDVASMIFWLSNRMPDIWKNRRDNTVDIKEKKAAAEEIKALAERLNDPE